MKFHLFQKKLFAFAVVVTAVILVGAIVCTVGPIMSSKGADYSIPLIDLSDPNNRPNYAQDAKYDELYNLITVDDGMGYNEEQKLVEISGYMAHPDSILINDNGIDKILTLYVDGHGKGPIRAKESLDGGYTYSDRLTTTPKSWDNSKETPTIYRLNKTNGDVWHVMISAIPKWPQDLTGDGFNVSISKDNCKTWTEFKNFYGKWSSSPVSPIVAMSSLIQLKEDGKFVDKWMGIFHDNNFNNFKTILTFDENGEMQWSKPVEYFKGKNKTYFNIAKGTQMCEVLMFRSPTNDNELCLITRSNSKKYNSLVSFSTDEGETWSEPKEACSALNGERHKLVDLGNGRLAITFRSIERDQNKIDKYNNGKGKWYSEGWIMWVGTYQDIKDYYNGDKTKEGQYRVKIAHTYMQGQENIERLANADTGYCGNVLLSDGKTIVTTTYGCFNKDYKNAYEVNGRYEYRTHIASKRINIDLLDELYLNIKNKA